MPECETLEHQWGLPPVESPGSQIVTMECERCGIGYTMQFRGMAGTRILADLKMFPAQGMHAMSAEMKTFFMRNWEQACKDLENAGHTVVRGTLEISGEVVVRRSGWDAIPLAGKIAIVICALAIAAVLVAYVLLPAIIVLLVLAGIFYAVTHWL
jgi:hypothetical protein